MRLVLTIDLERPVTLDEISAAVAKSGCPEALRDSEVGEAGTIEGKNSGITGTWEIEQGNSGEHQPHPLTGTYRAIAKERFARPPEVVIDPFAQVSVEADGAYVQAWLHVPRSAVERSSNGQPPTKPPASVVMEAAKQRKA